MESQIEGWMHAHGNVLNDELGTARHTQVYNICVLDAKLLGRGRVAMKMPSGNDGTGTRTDTSLWPNNSAASRTLQITGATHRSVQSKRKGVHRRKFDLRLFARRTEHMDVI